MRRANSSHSSTTGISLGASGDRERIPTAQMQQYESVSVDEDDSSNKNDEYDDDDDDDDQHLDNEENGELGRIRKSPTNGHRRRRRFSPGLHQGGGVVLGNAKFLLLFMSVTLGAVLIMWYSSKQSTKGRTKKADTTKDPSWFTDNDRVDEDNEGNSMTLKNMNSAKSRQEKYPVTYDLSWMQSDWNPFNLQSNKNDKEDITHWTPPDLPWTMENNNQNSDQSGVTAAYLMQPDVCNRLLVFVSEGDLYVTQYTRKTLNTPRPAARVTTTVGNVRTPRLHPTRPLVAFSATYQGRREVYLQDLSSQGVGAKRLTYWDDSHGVSRVVGWQDDHTLLIAAQHTSVGLPDLRLFQLFLATDGSHAVLDIDPVPLAQAEDAAVHIMDGKDDEKVTCFYFTRVSQPSHTLRYVGGTVEQLWAYCDGYDHAVPLTTDYRGTSKSPQIWQSANQQDYLLFASDRIVADGDEETWVPGTLNLWALRLPTPDDLYSDALLEFIQITDLACTEQGRTLQEYSVDSAKHNVVLRMGADLFEIASFELDAVVGGGKDGADPLDEPSKIAIQVVSDFHETQERLVPVNLVKHMQYADVLTLPSGQIATLLTLRGQTWMSPVLHDTSRIQAYAGAGQNMPPRRFRVAPGALMGGMMRILKSIHVPLYGDDDDMSLWGQRLAVVLATDPVSPTAEHAFYLLPIQENVPSAFADLEHAPKPFMGGHVSGGSTKEGGLGSIKVESVTVSPCGRRLAWADTDGRIAVMTLPLFHEQYNTTVQYSLLPDTNELGEDLDGSEADLVFSPGGRYLAITHSASNKFSIISIVDCGDPLDGTIHVGRVVQATPSRFNSMSPYWGQSRVDPELTKYADMLAEATGGQISEKEKSTTLFFLTDRDILNDAGSPWGTRAPMPHFPRRSLLYALPLLSVGTDGVLDPNVPLGRFSGGAPMEIFAADIQTLTVRIKDILKNKKKKDSSEESERQLEVTSRKLAHAMMSRGLSAKSPEIERILNKNEDTVAPSAAPSSEVPTNPFPEDIDIDFGPNDLTFARRAYRMVNIPESRYFQILAQTEDNGSIVLLDTTASYLPSIRLFSASSYPHDDYKLVPVTISGNILASCGLSTDRKFMYFVLSPDHILKVTKNSYADISSAVAEFSSGSITTHVSDTDDMALSIWPNLEYQQLYNDAWRLLRDYFYDTEMHQVDWEAIHARYVDLVDRCKKREELDDVLGQMAAELSALHVFVYGGEYNVPFEGDEGVIALHQPASLGASLKRTAEWKGYRITEIPHRDPDFNLVTGSAIYSPLSAQSLWQTGQKGLEVGDVIVGINGESVYNVPDINMLLRGMAGRSIRLEVLRLESGNNASAETVVPEPVLVVPLSQTKSANLRYSAWEYRTREMAKSLAQEAGFSVGYVHLRAMGGVDINAFAQGFFEDYNKQTLILDVRHNRGGNIDSWVTTMLQRAAWSYFGGRTRFGGGDLDWNQQGSFQGHVVVLIDEKTSSDGEGVSRSISELGLGRLIGKRTWGGGIWLASDNNLVDGGIATAPEFGVYNDKFGWGLGIEQQGVEPDIEVDNDPRMWFDGKDTQLERAIAELKAWLEEEPVVIPKAPATKPDMSIPAVSCPSTR